ncbi:unnamed protein product [Polarella glacialis]|uniref:EF-hand domain-containing protein n=1 Tax=Polarella glacialis TaxID=89957 RepID=A0A813EHG1_POLGL|nr:unnamed protein product [Polarella glacialis]|eukprot:CAMPEP_0115095440 /NCGR_PEP_ID=MMETSP0227-20121206/29037_1 /TAXON_ID=89957 /ORGANISM="Polarella glacialis, Strain CCMP 1383" /LENGTH=369 /DNA_ID=CAMNT_0002488799 /DNA_START=146 /DNA_END=1255 /DNA_ORIENTATION=-
MRKILLPSSLKYNDAPSSTSSDTPSKTAGPVGKAWAPEKLGAKKKSRPKSAIRAAISRVRVSIVGHSSEVAPAKSLGFASRVRVSIHRRSSQVLDFITGFNGANLQDAKADDLSLDSSFDAINLAREHGIPAHEVRFIAKRLAEAQRDMGGEGTLCLNMNVFYNFLCGVFDADQIDKQFVLDAYQPFDEGGQDFNLANFLAWYKQHMFSDVAPRLAAKDKASSDALIYQMAAKHHVCPVLVDRIKTVFDKVDLDKSGKIEYVEFVEMMSQIMHAQKEDFGSHRLQLFWKEAETSRDGHVDFSEFVAWYVKYFADGVKQNGPLESYYESFMQGPSLLLQARGVEVSAEAKKVPGKVGFNAPLDLPWAHNS